MNATTHRALTPARLVALVLIGLVMFCLAYLRFGNDGAAVSVPEGARAGQLTLESCHYDTEDGSYAADCGTLVVPENRADPESRLIALPVTRVRARSEHPGTPVFRLEGGPGKTNMAFPLASRFAQDRDVVLVGYRGVDGSSVLDCPEVESALSHSTDFLRETSLRRYGDAFRACAERLTGEGVDLDGYTLPQRVDDLEAARIGLGYDRVDLLSESAGTRTAMIYSWRYPRSIHRSVMIAANPPGHFVWDGRTTDEQISRYAALCSQDEACSARTDDLAATLERKAAHMPDRWLFLPIREGNVRLATFFGLMESTPEAAPFSSPMTLGAWLSADEGDASGLWLQSVLAGLTFPKSFVWGEYASMGRADAQAARDHFASVGRRPDSLGEAASAFAWGGGRLADAWPAAPDEAEYSRVRTSNVETLLIGGELDFATPPQNATRELLPHLPNGRQVVLPGFGHSDTFWADQPEAGTRLVNVFLASGRVDTSRYETATVDLTPALTQTVLAKGIVGTMVGLAALTVLSLLLIARRVRRRGRLGRKAAAVLRAVYPIVLGLGGWFLGVLVAVTAMPGTPLDDEILACLSVGLPIGLGVYYAWVHRAWSLPTRATGFAAALGCALVGGWLGFGVAEGLAALLTTIAGAAVGANLALVLLDIAWDRQGRDRAAAVDAGSAPDARPAVG